MKILERDLQIAEGMALDLKPYLLSHTLYWPITSGGFFARSMYRGTLGGLLMRIHQLECLRDELSGTQQQRLTLSRERTYAELDRWVVQKEHKAKIEVKARVRQWSLYVSELEESTQYYADEYTMQARGRTALHFALQAANRAIDGSGMFTRLIIADRKLTKVVRESDFLLNELLQRVYPRHPFWWLHVRPVPPDEKPLFG